MSSIGNANNLNGLYDLNNGLNLPSFDSALFQVDEESNDFSNSNSNTNKENCIPSNMSVPAGKGKYDDESDFKEFSHDTRMRSVSSTCLGSNSISRSASARSFQSSPTISSPTSSSPTSSSPLFSSPSASSPSPFFFSPSPSPTSSISPFVGSNMSKDDSSLPVVEKNAGEVGKIRYSQSSCASKISQGISLDDLATNMKRSGFKKRNPISIVKMPDGAFTSLDNRRLFAAHQAIFVQRTAIKVYAVVHEHGDLIESEMDKDKYQSLLNDFNELLKNESSRSQKVWKKNPEGIDLNTWGHMIILRMKNGTDSIYQYTGDEKYGYKKITVRE